MTGFASLPPVTAAETAAETAADLQHSELFPREETVDVLEDTEFAPL